MALYSVPHACLTHELGEDTPSRYLALADEIVKYACTMGHAEQAQLGTWASHPLSKALLAQPLSHPGLMLGTQCILSQAAQAGNQHRLQLLQQLLVPFISFVLLRPDVTGRHRMFAIARALA